MSRRTAGVLLIAVSAASFGAMAIFARLAYDGGADVAAVLFLRFALRPGSGDKKAETDPLS